MFISLSLFIYLLTLLFDMLHIRSNRRPWDWLIYSRCRIQRFTLGACWERGPSEGFMRQLPSICVACVAQQLLPWNSWNVSAFRERYLLNFWAILNNFCNCDCVANPTADEVAEFLSEIEMLKGVGTHNNVVCFLGCCTIRAPYLMIMEYVGRGNLVSY